MATRHWTSPVFRIILAGRCRDGVDYIGSRFCLEWNKDTGESYASYWDRNEYGHYGILLDYGAERRQDLIWSHSIGHCEVKEVYSACHHLIATFP